MILITQFVYIKKGQEDIFHQFENVAIPIISKYNGRLLLRLRPETNSVIENSIEVPYEVHIVEFDSEKDFEDFKHDEERKNLLPLKDRSVESILLIKGEKLT